MKKSVGKRRAQTQLVTWRKKQANLKYSYFKHYIYTFNISNDLVVLVDILIGLDINFSLNFLNTWHLLEKQNARGIFICAWGLKYKLKFKTRGREWIRTRNLLIRTCQCFFVVRFCCSCCSLQRRIYVLKLFINSGWLYIAQDKHAIKNKLETVVAGI